MAPNLTNIYNITAENGRDEVFNLGSENSDVLGRCPKKSSKREENPGGARARRVLDQAMATSAGAHMLNQGTTPDCQRCACGPQPSLSEIHMQ